ncbi:Hypothetical predicted protein, partial [Marmota monax]
REDPFPSPCSFELGFLTPRTLLYTLHIFACMGCIVSYVVSEMKGKRNLPNLSPGKVPLVHQEEFRLPHEAPADG